MTVSELLDELERKLKSGKLDPNDEVLVYSTNTESWETLDETLTPGDGRFMLAPEGWDD